MMTVEREYCVNEIKCRNVQSQTIAKIGAIAVIALGLFAGSIAEAAFKFHSVSSSVNSTGALVVNFDERGLGDDEQVNYTLTADATAFYACINGGGKHPKAENKESFEGQV